MKKIVSGILLSAVSAGVVFTAALASVGLVQKTLLYDDIKITLDSREIKPSDVNGNYIEPFIIEGTTYLPVRGIANSLGLEVGWDDAANTVILNEPQSGVKSVLYDEDGLKIIYKGIENTDRGVRMTIFVQNDSENDIYLKLADISADGKKLEDTHECLFIKGAKANTVLTLENVEKADKLEFCFFVTDARTHTGICGKTNVTADSEGAKPETEEKELPPFEVDGEVTWQSFTEFFRTHGEYSSNKGLYFIDSSFTDAGRYDVGSLTMGCSASSREISLEITVITDVHDSVSETTALAPVNLRIEIIQNEEVYKYDMYSLLNKIPWNVTGEINASDGSSKVTYSGFSKIFNDVEKEYTTLEAQNALEDMAQNISEEVLNVMIEESKKVFAEKAPDLSLEFFGIK